MIGSIDIELTEPIKDFPLLVDLFLENGWSIDDHGVIRFSPADDEELSDWATLPLLCQDEVFNIFLWKNQKGFPNGVVLLNEGSGGSLLQWANGTLSFLIQVNAKKIDNSITDFSWYLRRIVPTLEQGRLKIASIQCEQQI